jgi:hypothetical protein
MGHQGSTTNYGHQHPEVSRWAREGILDLPGSFPRMHTGAKSSFWSGKLARIYLTSAIWNIRHKQLFKALSRLFHGLWSMILAGRFVLAGDFWGSLGKPYKSITFERGLRESGKEPLA